MFRPKSFIKFFLSRPRPRPTQWTLPCKSILILITHAISERRFFVWRSMIEFVIVWLDAGLISHIVYFLLNPLPKPFYKILTLITVLHGKQSNLILTFSIVYLWLGAYLYDLFELLWTGTCIGAFTAFDSCTPSTYGSSTSWLTHFDFHSSSGYRKWRNQYALRLWNL